MNAKDRTQRIRGNTTNATRMVTGFDTLHSSWSAVFTPAAPSWNALAAATRNALNQVFTERREE